ncbi:PAS domain-containing sensor histidine kinase [Tianweitania sp. BSSL-BM11]|uniref:histidine kinase n=1 Tax=Tianweitania aestuarii TaxID=2814886 RepID=A0ABS5RTM8_9HYPH|nr:PAS domain-containing sensor histidine kinase [Tianweitania aestuarii]MBS9720411.1 PAS domain-containing sensor histidine kinase [Tianweitania aestuarii]
MTAQAPAASGPLLRQTYTSEGRRVSLLPGVIAVVCALVVGGISFTILMGLTPIEPNEEAVLALIGANALSVLVLFGLISREIYRIYRARRAGRAASRLHVRIVAMFALIAAIPAILVAVVASISLDVGLDRWFEIRTKTIINTSLSIAEAYVQENARNLQGTTLSMAHDLDQSRSVYNLDRTGFRELMQRHVIGRALAGAVLIRADGSFEMSADAPNNNFEIPPPPIEAVRTAADGKPVLIPPLRQNIVGAIIRLKELPDLYLYTIRLVDPEVIRARQIVRANADAYRDLGNNRRTTQIAFALIYIGLTLIIVLSAIWTGIAVADRIVRPIRQLIGAADKVASGNMDAAVQVRATDGDVASLGDTFNKMVQELKSQRNEILSARDDAEDRRRFSEAVLSGVTAGVIGVDPNGEIQVVNRSALTMLALPFSTAIGKNLSEVLPHVGGVLNAARELGRAVYREQVTFFRAGAERTFNVQVTIEESGEENERSYVVTVDDITDLVQAQRSSAWADVARRIAHEIKNPLTPIQLSAERIRRRYGKVITEDREVFDQCTDTIIRQVGDIGRMVDEFSAFARMPKPELKLIDLREALHEASFLVEVSRSEISFERDFGSVPLKGQFDSRLLSQAFGNIIKNAAEAIEGAERTDGVIRVASRREGAMIQVDVMDNGKGLPRENRQRLLEPYMTTREKGTGLGLAIVKKIVEDHGGHLELHDAPKDFHEGRGALIRIVLPAVDQVDRNGAGTAPQPVAEKVIDGL